MRVILNLSNYNNLTGSEIYVYELARELHKRGAFVSIIANQIGGEIAAKTPKGINLYHFFDHPEIEAELVISSQPNPTTYALSRFRNSKHYQVLHSLLPYEEPILDSKIKKYIAVRPDVAKHWSTKYPEIDKKIKVIWNGVDTRRFNEKNKEMRPNRVFTRLFIGTYDHLRARVVDDLILEAVKNGTYLWLVGDNYPPKNPVSENVTHYPATWKTEMYTRACDETAGIFIGRTTIEGFMCGKPGMVYNVDMKGTITDKMTIGVPENRHIFDIKYMTDRILEL